MTKYLRNGDPSVGQPLPAQPVDATVSLAGVGCRFGGGSVSVPKVLADQKGIGVLKHTAAMLYPRVEAPRGAKRYVPSTSAV